MSGWAQASATRRTGRRSSRSPSRPARAPMGSREGSPRPTRPACCGAISGSDSPTRGASARGTTPPPARGALSDLQHTTFLMISQGVRARVAGPFHLYTNLIYHSALYHDTGTSELDARELTLDSGLFLKFKRGPEWLAGLTEDLEPSGPAIDVAFRFGARW